MNSEELRQLIRDGNVDAVRQAIQQNPDLVHVQDSDPELWQEFTPLHCAAWSGKLDIVKMLVEAGATVYTNPLTTYPPIFVADHNQHFKDRDNAQHVVDYFLNEIPEKAAGTNGLGVTIHLAARAGWTEIVKQHLEKDPLSVHQRGLLGDTPLHWSSHNGNVDIVRMLLDAGADINADELGCYGGKPLHWASEHEVEVVKLLLERGANVDATNDLESSDFFGFTPLQMNVAMKDDCAEVTQLLLDAGADSTVKHNGRSLLQMAEDNKNTRICDALRGFGLQN